MKKTLLSVLLLIFLVSTVAAQTANEFTTSTNQYYSVVFDEEKEGIVSLLLNVRNFDEKIISDINIEIPGDSVTLIGVAQESVNSETCADWSSQCAEFGDGQTCVQYDYSGNCVSYERPCLRTSVVCRQYKPNYNYQPQYSRIKVEPVKLSHSVSLPILLSSPVNPQGNTNNLIMYKVQDYVDNMAGSYNFDFETAKTPFNSNSVRVAISVQDGLYLKGTKSQVNYLSNIAGMSDKMAGASMTAEMSKDIYSYTRTIQNAQGLVKSASYLDPYESFSVKGSYAKSWFRLHLGDLFLWGIIIALVIMALSYGTKKLFKSMQPVESKKNTEDKISFIVPFMSGLFSAIGISLIWIVTIVLIQFMNNYYGYGSNIFALMLVVFGLLLSLGILIGVPIFAGSRFGAVTGIFTLVSILGWMFLFSIVGILLTGLLYQRTVYY